MQYQANTVEEYIDQLPKDRKEPITKLRKVINQNIDRGFSEEINYGMIGWVVPHSLYPNGYHCDPKLPTPIFKHHLPKTLYCSLPHGRLCQPTTSGMVHK